MSKSPVKLYNVSPIFALNVRIVWSAEYVWWKGVGVKIPDKTECRNIISG